MNKASLSGSYPEDLAEVYQARATLGLPAQPGSGEDLGQVPPDLDQTFSSVLAAQADLIQSAAQFGVIHSYAQSPKQMLDDFAKQGDIDRYFAQLTTRGSGRQASRGQARSRQPRSRLGRTGPTLL
jgi:hypothetical protein